MKVLLLVCVCVFVFSTSSFSETLRFAIIGDRAGTPNQKAFEQVVQDVQLMSPDIVMTVGDIADNCDEKEWDTALNSLKKLTMPIYYVPGNNDIVDDKTEALYMKKTGMRPYYSFDRDSSHFIVVDNSRPDTVEAFDKVQFTWLEKDLAAVQNKTIFVFMHKPFWGDAIASGKKDPLHELFKKYKVSAVFTGHWHQYAHDVIDGIDYYLVGSSGGAFESVDESMGMFYQFMWCTVKDGKLTVAPMRSPATFDRDLVTMSEEKMHFAVGHEYIRSSGVVSVTSPDVTAQISIKNATDKPIASPLTIVFPSNWTSSYVPSQMTIQSGATQNQTISMTYTGSIFPLPVVKYSYAFGRNKVFNYEQPLALTREITAVAQKKAVVIDGIIRENEWTSAVQVTDLCTFAGTKTSAEPTVVYLTHDDKNLYIAVVCSDSDMGKIKADVITRDGQTYTDDCVGFMISTDGKAVRQLYVNSNGIVWDLFADLVKNEINEQWNGDYEVACTKNIDNWVVELKIPYKTIGYDKKIGSLFMNMRRKQIRNKQTALFTPAWSFEPNKYAVIKIQ